jgi:hypothetical protein
MNEVQKTSSQKKIIITTVIVLFIVGIGALVYFLMNNNQKQENNLGSNLANDTASNSSQTTNTTQSRTVPSGMKLYENKDHNFSFVYPEALPITTDATSSTLKQGENTNVITFLVYNPENKSNWELFRITFVELVDISKSLDQYLTERYNVAPEVTWSIENESYAVDSKAYVASNAESIDSLGDLPGIGGDLGYFKDPTSKYFVTIGIGQDAPNFFSKTYGVKEDIARDIVDSIRWN